MLLVKLAVQVRPCLFDVPMARFFYYMNIRLKISIIKIKKGAFIMNIQQSYFKGDGVAERQIGELTEQLTIIHDPIKVKAIVTMIRNIDSQGAFKAGKESGYRQGFQSSVMFN